MNRYFYYFTFVNMITNIITTVPIILIQSRKEGVIISMILSVVGGLVITYLLVKFFNAFPGEGLPEVLKKYMPKWLTTPLMIYIAITWFAAGLITLTTYSFLIKRFLTPDMRLSWIVICFLIFISYGILMKSKSVLYTLEIVFLSITPLILLLIIKAYGSKDIEWDFVRESMMYIRHLPNYSAFTASLFIFLGPANLIIFNRVFTKKQFIKWKQILMLGAVGVFVLFTTYFVPIGFNGFEHIETIVYPWSMTSDSIRMPYGLVERVMYMFMLFFLAITFMSMLIHWHVAIELFLNVIYFKRFKWKKHNLTPFLFVVLFWIITLKVVTYLTEPELVTATRYFFNVLPFSFSALLIIFWLIKRRARI
ncbi:GerAB/ArcD/ProY family transporter [Lederbergia lenta]|uniref:GerAB/ArcD/ProY family transporter n=1 Tax=Lederbergia lenta TaxID=1467 RepID=UPI002040AB72|nr:GerAB/ArcD/ProY family transporter [Lederbergia lenta]MCM3112580.1 GerAB/ArcD/ProY family transporter [Lederbergia lenta]